MCVYNAFGYFRSKNKSVKSVSTIRDVYLTSYLQANVCSLPSVSCVSNLQIPHKHDVQRSIIASTSLIILLSKHAYLEILFVQLCLSLKFYSFLFTFPHVFTYLLTCPLLLQVKILQRQKNIRWLGCSGGASWILRAQFGSILRQRDHGRYPGHQERL